MTTTISRRAVLAAGAAGALLTTSRFALAADKITLRISRPMTPTDQRAVALTGCSGPGHRRLRDLRAALERHAVQAGHRA